MIDRIINNKYLQLLTIRRNQYLLSAGLIVIFAIIYFLPKLFVVNDGNDFGEYFVRAERWARGDWWWGGGSDKLLSFMEYLPIVFFPKDFIAIYRSIQLISISLILLSSFVFLIRKNAFLPPFTIRIFIVIAYLSMPFMMFKSIAVDQSLLFTAMLLLFLGTYNIPWLGVVSLLVFISRPESPVIFPLYIVFFIFDKSNRKNILINFISFLIILALYKYFDAKMNPVEYVEYSILGKNVTGIFTFTNLMKVALNVLSVPLIIIIFCMEILQNYVAVIFLLIGLIFSIREKKMYAFYTILITYIFLIIALNPTWDFPFAKSFKVIFENTRLFNDKIAFDFVDYGHSRYRVFLYPSIAAFIIFGILYTLDYVSVALFPDVQAAKNKTVKSKKNTKESNKTPHIQEIFVVVGIIAITSLLAYNYITAFPKSVDDYTYDGVMPQKIHPAYKLALRMRAEHTPEDYMMMDDMCDGSCGSFTSIMTIFSGIRYIYVKVCDNCPGVWIRHDPKNRVWMPKAEMDSLNPSWIVLYDYFTVHYPRTINNQELHKRVFQYYYTALDSAKVKYIMNTKISNVDKFVLKYKEDNINIYKYNNN